DSDDQHRAKFDHFAIGGRAACAAFFGECSPRPLDRIAGQNVIGADQPGIHDAFSQRQRHLSRAEEANLQIRSHFAVLSPAARQRKAKGDAADATKRLSSFTLFTFNSGSPTAGTQTIRYCIPPMFSISAATWSGERASQ